ncbi:conserved hypothetical protein [Talaromyces stipitatus ATCC 10500]|uniref:DUF453 domain protein n=1 Tax=Talaromyces stipitatus (strain ATCC 10500 / CBS 375.48 / QM 6759 / NRRL 1006) TaxID=441959 RepID=B8LUS3_TALSN|nr:uncharacterized protein TSTA_073200 [Talaromyces stipitatus ATCC 10500]EED23930.1 conserved hypothetical protein [Talaromyces stipitatus ATCC 10500]
MPTAYSPVSIETQKPRVPSQLIVKATGTALDLSRQKRYRLKSVLMRSGTSRGLFLHRHDLPPSPSDWDSVLIGAMGSRYNDPRQLEGVGGATSTTSKVVIVAKSDRPGIDVEYTFAQVTVGQEKVDMTGNCGNMASGVAAFALEEGLITAAPGQMEISVRIFNTNTKSMLIETIQLDGSGHFLEEGDYRIGGVKGTGSKIRVSFVKPGGSMTGSTFPTGNREDELLISPSSSNLSKEPFTVKATLIDVSNPFIFVDSSSLPPEYYALGQDSEASLEIIEAIRRGASVKFGFASDTQAAGLRKGTPKIAIVSTPVVPNSNLTSNDTPDISVLAYSMGKVHPSVQLTGAVCLGAAANLKGTVVERLRRKAGSNSDGAVTAYDEQLISGKKGGLVVISHNSGTIDVDVDVTANDEVESITVFRTARRVFEGTIFVSG